LQASKLAVSATQKTKELTQAVNEKVLYLIFKLFIWLLCLLICYFFTSSHIAAFYLLSMFLLMYLVWIF